MNSWHIETDFVAIFIFLALFIKAQVNTRRKTFTDRTFITANLLGILSTVVDIVSSTIMNYPVNWWAYEIGMILYGICAPLLTLLWVLYTVSLLYGEDEHREMRIIWILLFPYLAYILLCITNPIHSLFFSLTPDLVYTRGPLFVPLGVGSQMLYAAVGIFLVLLHWRNLKLHATAALLMLLYIMTTACYWVQMLFPGWLIICSAYALAFLVCDAVFESQRRDRLYQEIQASLEETRDVNAALSRQMAITGAIASAYSATYTIDLDRNLLTEITATDDIRAAIGGQQDARRCTAAIHVYADVAYMDTIRTFLNLSTLNERMRNLKIITCDFKNRNGSWLRGGFIELERDKDGNLHKVVCVMRPINDEMERELAYQKKLEETALEASLASRAKSSFLSRMSHDIRTPINGIRGMLEIIRKNREDAARVDDCLQKIEISSGYLLSLVNDVLDMSMLESGEITLGCSPFHLPELLSECRSVLAPMATERNVCLEIDAGDGLPCPYLMGSSVHLRQVIVNIVGNAIKYNRPGGSVHCTVEESDRTETDVLCRFTIADTGIGMSPEFLEHLYEPFSQEHAGSRSRYGGTGLGLAIVKRILDQMGGDIQVESTPGTGSCFTVSLRLKLDPEPAVPEPPAENAAGSADLSGIRILLVEDNELNQEIARFMLEDAGATVDTAENGQIALDMFRSSSEGTWQAILMDIMMPVMDGITASRNIRALQRKDAGTVVIIAVTANAFVEDAHHCLEAGMDAHLAKPLDSETLVHTLIHFLHLPVSQHSRKADVG